MSLAPLTYRLRKLVGRSRGIQDAAAEMITVSPAETGRRAAAVYMPGQTDRVQAVQPMTTVAFEQARISDGIVEHAPTLAFRLRNAVLMEGTVFCAGAMCQMASRRSPRLPRQVRSEISEPVSIIGTAVSDMFFGHYVVDDTATTLLADGFAPVHTTTSRHRGGWHHAPGYYRLLGLQPAALPNARLREAWLFQDIGMNANRRARLEEVRRRMRPRAQRRGGHGVMIIRGKSGEQHRNLANELELAEALAQRGFEIVDPVGDSLETIIDKLAGAAVVVGIEGSNLAHALLLMADRAALVIIQQPFMFNNVWKDFTDLLGMTYAFVVGAGTPEQFVVDINEVLQTIALATGRDQAPAS